MHTLALSINALLMNMKMQSGMIVTRYWATITLQFHDDITL